MSNYEVKYGSLFILAYFTSRSTFANREEDRKPVKAGSNPGDALFFFASLGLYQKSV
jgi:hypothetical protein